jgi:RimJ/RimL family protein N-acetyltransferase
MLATLTTDRLVLRPVRLSDAPAIQRHFATWDIIQHLSRQVPWPYPEDGAETYLRDVLLPAMEEGRLLAWALVLREGPDEPIGLLEYRPEGTDSRGFWLAVPFQGRGLMTEAVIAFQDHVFFDLDVDQLTVHNLVSNAPSRRIKEKTGAQLVGTVEMEHHHGGAETQRWVVTRERWAELRGRE